MFVPAVDNQAAAHDSLRYEQLATVTKVTPLSGHSLALKPTGTIPFVTEVKR